MVKFFTKHYKESRQDVVILFMLSFIVGVLLLYKYFYPDKSKDYYNDFSLTPVEWQRFEFNNRVTYTLSRDTGKALIITCRAKRFTIHSYGAMSVVRLLKDNEERTLTSMGIDGKLWHVPVINDDPNPTKEQVLFLRALSKAKIVTFRLDNVKYTWPTSNQTTLNHCVNLNDEQLINS